MSAGNGKGTPVRSALCKGCGMAVEDPQIALYVDEEWFCDINCHNRHLGGPDGQVPA